MKKVLILNGPNINILGIREPNIYGNVLWKDIEKDLIIIANSLQFKISFFQSNSESVLIDHIQSLLRSSVDLIIFNPAGYTGSSISLRDSLLAVGTPFFEVHISNIWKREAIHKSSVFSDIAQGILIGLGNNVYAVALYAAKYFFQTKE